MTFIYQDNNLLSHKIICLFIYHLKCIYWHKDIDQCMLLRFKMITIFYKEVLIFWIFMIFFRIYVSLNPQRNNFLSEKNTYFCI